MSDRRRTPHVSPAELAKVDQAAAQLGELVAAARGHMAICSVVPAGLCVGTVGVRLRELTCQARYELLEEAVAQLARAAPPDGGDTP